MDDINSRRDYYQTSGIAVFDGASKGHTSQISNLLMLKRSGWFSDLPGEVQSRLALLGRWIVLSPKQRLFSAGDEADGFFGLIVGDCDILMPVTKDEECAFMRISEGYWFDDCALTSAKARTVSVEAVTPSRIFFVSYKAVLRHLADHPQDWRHFCMLFSANLEHSNVALSEALSLPANIRLLRLILRLAGKNGRVNATQDELARLAGVSRATFRRSLSSLIEDGFIRTTYGAIEIADRASLEGRANRSHDPE